MPLQRPGEPWEQWKDRVDRWIVNAEQDDLHWMATQTAARPDFFKTTYQHNPDYRGQTYGNTMLKILRNARKNQAYVTLLRQDPTATREERRLAIAFDVDWSRLVGDDWLQRGAETLMEWRCAYEVEREFSKTGEVTYEHVKQVKARLAAKKAAGVVPMAGPPRRRGLFDRLRGRGNTE